MLTVNDTLHPYVPGETVEDALKRTKSFFPFMAVQLNGRWLRKEEWNRVVVDDGSTLRTVEMIAGG